MVNPFIKIYRYRWVHIETGKTGVREVECSLREEFLELLNNWNRDSRWKFSEE